MRLYKSGKNSHFIIARTNVWACYMGLNMMLGLNSDKDRLDAPRDPEYDAELMLSALMHVNIMLFALAALYAWFFIL